MMKFILETIEFDDYNIQDVDLTIISNLTNTEITMLVQSVNSLKDLIVILDYILKKGKNTLQIQQKYWEKIRQYEPKDGEDFDYINLLYKISINFDSNIIDYKWIFDKILDYVHHDDIVSITEMEDSIEYIDILVGIGKYWPNSVDVDFNKVIKKILSFNTAYYPNRIYKVLTEWDKKRVYWDLYKYDYIRSLITEYYEYCKDVDNNRCCNKVINAFEHICSNYKCDNEIEQLICSFLKDVECNYFVCY